MPQAAVGVVVALIALFVFVGGMQRIAKVTETLVPIMAAFYILGALIVIIYNYKNIPYAFQAIVVGAFNPSAVSGGAVGATLKLALTKGVARGLFSNEAGMGSTPHAHAVAKVDHPVEQGFVAMIGVFIDTFIVLNLTAFVIITTKSIPSGKTGAELSQYASLHCMEKAEISLSRFVCSSSHFQQLLAGISLDRQILSICLDQKL